MGFPGSSINSIKKQTMANGKGKDVESDDSEGDEDDENFYDRPLDPRAGSVHVDLPQIPIDLGGLINLLRKYERGKFTPTTSKRKIRVLIQKYGGILAFHLLALLLEFHKLKMVIFFFFRFSVLKKGKYPTKIKKDPIIDEKKIPRQTLKTARQLLEFTENLDEKPIKSKEFASISKQLKEEENGDVDEISEDEDDGDEDSETELKDENDLEMNDVDVESEDDVDELEGEEVESEEKISNKIEVKKTKKNNSMGGRKR